MSTAINQSSSTSPQDTLFHGGVCLSYYLLKERPGRVLGTEIFGDCARRRAHQQSDLDFIVLVNGETHRQWMKLIDEHNNGNLDFREVRKYAAVEVLGLYHGSLRVICGDATSARLNVFLFPVDWQNRLDELQKEVLGDDDPMFMKNIAQDAIAYDPQERSFMFV